MITINPPVPDSAKGVPQPKPKRQAGPVSILASAALATTTIATAISFCRIFPGWGFLGPVLITVISVHAVLTVARALQWPIYVAAPIALATMATVIGMLYFRSTLFGFVPTRATWDAAWVSLSDAFGLFRTTVAPVPSDSGFGVATALAMGTVAGLADTFAFRAFGRIESIVPCGLLFALGSSLGVDRNRLPVTALWLACVFIAVAVLRAAHGENGATWLGTRTGGRLGPTARAAIGLGSVAVLAGVVLGPRLPGVDDDAIINTRTRTGKGTEVLSPMVEVQSRLVNRSNTEMFTYSLPGGEPAYLRLASLGEFDGKSFTEEGSFADATDFVGDQPGGPVREVVQSIKITSLGGIWMPAVASPVSIEPTAGFEYDPSTSSIIRREKLFNGMQYGLVSLVPVIDPAALQTSGSTAPNDRYLAVPSDFPQELIRTANEIVAGQTSIYNQMIALQTWFRDGFDYNVNVSRGHSIRSIEGFLRAKEGYCEQFAVTFAAFARAIGVPSRVAVGFTPGDKDAAGLYHVLGKHAHAWPEIWFDDVGWVLFEPTPDRGAPGAESYTGVAPAEDGGQLTGTPDIAGPNNSGRNTPDGEPKAPTTTVFNPRTSIPKDLPNPDSKGATPAQRAATASGGVPTAWLVILGLIVVLGAWAVLMPLVVRHLARRRYRNEIDDVVDSWDRAARWLGVAGAPRKPEETPVEHAERAWRATGVGRDQVRELALEATRATFKPTPPTPDAVDRCRQLSRRVITVVRDQLSWRDRLRARFDPRLQ